ncbi:MAG: VOC family protein [Pyrinomonadaceae bacterium]
MAESFVEQLDQAVAAVLANAETSLSVGTEVEPFVRIASELRYLPRQDFRARLREELGRTANMTPGKAASEGDLRSEISDLKSQNSDLKTQDFSFKSQDSDLESQEDLKPSKPAREGFHTITPYLAVKEAPLVIEFVKKAFGAKGKIYGVGSQGGIHSEYKIGDSMVMIGGGEAWRGTPMPTALHLYVDDVDVVYQRALDAGATSMNGPIEDHGERLAGVKDLSGNEWYIAKRLSGTHTDEGLRNVNVYLHPLGAAQMIEFLKPAFGAEEVAVYRIQPDGPVVHAKIRIGDSVLEMGEAHGPYQPMPTMFFLYVDDVDAWYERAVAAGAKSMSEPVNQPYGDRVAEVTDPFGNTWYIATHLQQIGS